MERSQTQRQLPPHRRRRNRGEMTSVVFVADMESDAAIGQFPDIGDPDGQSSTQLAFAAGDSIRREAVVGLAGEGDAIGEQPRSAGSLDAVGFLKIHRLAPPIGSGKDPPDQQTLRWQARIPAVTSAVLQEKILAAVLSYHDLVTLSRVIPDGSENQLLGDPRIEHHRFDPPQLFLAPGRWMLRSSTS